MPLNEQHTEHAQFRRKVPCIKRKEPRVQYSHVWMLEGEFVCWSVLGCCPPPLSWATYTTAAFQLHSHTSLHLLGAMSREHFHLLTKQWLL